MAANELLKLSGEWQQPGSGSRSMPRVGYGHAASGVGGQSAWGGGL